MNKRFRDLVEFLFIIVPYSITKKKFQICLTTMPIYQNIIPGLCRSIITINLGCIQYFIWPFFLRAMVHFFLFTALYIWTFNEECYLCIWTARQKNLCQHLLCDKDQVFTSTPFPQQAVMLSFKRNSITMTRDRDVTGVTCVQILLVKTGGGSQIIIYDCTVYIASIAP